MKNLIIALLFIGYAHQTNAQSAVPINEELNSKKVPLSVIESITKDYETYSLKDLFGVSLENVQQSVLAFKDDNTYVENDTFQLTLSKKGKNGANGQMVLTYNKFGKLLNVYQSLKNDRLPVVVRNTVAKNNPGWAFVKTKYQMVHHTGKAAKESYKFVLQKDNVTKKITTDSYGNSIKTNNYSLQKVKNNNDK